MGREIKDRQEGKKLNKKINPVEKTMKRLGGSQAHDGRTRIENPSK
jgi:hypothetical protein